MADNIYHEGLASLFKKAGRFRDESVWSAVYNALLKLEPDKNNKELRRQITECFETLEAESDDDKLSLFFLSFLIGLSANSEYFEKFIEICLRSANLTGSSKFYCYNFCHTLMKEKLYLRSEENLGKANAMFDICFKMFERYLDAEINNIKSGGGSVLLIASELGEYPFGAVKHILDFIRYFKKNKRRVNLVITHEHVSAYGKIHLHPVSCYKSDTGENTAAGILEVKKADDGIKIYEFNTENSFVSEAKQAFLFIRELKPSLVINVSGKSIIAELLGKKIPCVSVWEASLPDNADTQKKALELLGAGDKYSKTNNYREVKRCLYSAYLMLANTNSKAKALEQLVRTYVILAEREKALAAARELFALDESLRINDPAQASGKTAWDACALAFALAGDKKSAIFLRERLRGAEGDSFSNNLKLFELYSAEKRLDKAEELNGYFLGSGNYEAEALIFQFYHRTFNEKEAFKHIAEAARLSLAANEQGSYFNSLTVALSSSLYYEPFTDDEYISLAWENYNGMKPYKENDFTGYKPVCDKIRLGFASGKLAAHPVGFFISSLFKEEKGNGGLFEYYFYYTSLENEEDDITRLIEKGADFYEYVGDLPYAKLSERILADKLDIFIDLNGLSDVSLSNVLINRLAPVQMTWIGFPCTLPIKNIDYNIADVLTDPPGVSEKYYTEKLLYLPKTFLCYGVDPKDEVKELPLKKNGYVTFGSFNNANKYSDSLLEIWAEVLEKIPDARFIVRTLDAGEKYSRDKLKEKFLNNGVDIFRVSFLPTTHRRDYYDSYNDVDIILDTYPFNGATTTCDAFLMGKPVISMYGGTHVTRVGLSMLTNIGLSDLAVPNREGYVQKCLELSNDVKRLEELNRNLRGRLPGTPLFNCAEFKRDFEETVFNAYQNHFK